MVGSREPAGQPDWRRPEAYAYTLGFTRRAWAWEFLRRNPDFQRSWPRANRAMTIETQPPHLTVLTANGSTGEIAQWGVLFR